MDIRQRFFGQVAKPDDRLDDVQLDAGALVEYLLLFERVVIDSIRLKDIRELTRVFGYSAMRALLASNAVDVYCDAVTLGEVGRAMEKRLPLYSYAFRVVRIADRETYLHGCLQEMHRVPGISRKHAIKLKSAILTKLKGGPPAAGGIALRQLTADLRSNTPLAKKAVARSIHRLHGLTVTPNDFALTIHVRDDGDFHVETDISRRLQLSDEAAHTAVSRGLLAVGALNRRIELMQEQTALVGVHEPDLPLLEDKLSFLEPHLAPEAQRQQLHRVLTITGFPTLTNITPGSVDLERVLEIRESDACRRFREWLRGAGAVPDREIEEQFQSVRQRLAPLVHGYTGKVIRWAASTGLGAIQGAGQVAGAVAGLLDTFLLERLIPQPGPISFLGSLYPSIFKDT